MFRQYRLPHWVCSSRVRNVRGISSFYSIFCFFKLPPILLLFMFNVNLEFSWSQNINPFFILLTRQKVLRMMSILNRVEMVKIHQRHKIFIPTASSDAENHVFANLEGRTASQILSFKLPLIFCGIEDILCVYINVGKCPLKRVEYTMLLSHLCQYWNICDVCLLVAH